jgi:hypothetical protein
LFPQTQAIKVALDSPNQALPDLNEFTSWQIQAAASRGEIMKGSGVRAVQNPAPDHQVCGDRIQCHRLKDCIGEASQHAAKVVLEGLP